VNDHYAEMNSFVYSRLQGLASVDWINNRKNSNY